MGRTQAKSQPRTRTLLVVDDREANLVAMEALLGDGDWQVHTVNSGEAALQALLELDVELVLLDVQMPGMDGFEVARLMRGSPHTRYTPIIFVSAIAHTRESVLRGYATGAVDFILKPFDPLFRDEKTKGSRIPIVISGPREKPKFGLEWGKVFK